MKAIAAIVLALAIIPAAVAADNAKLKRMFEEDQEDREAEKGDLRTNDRDRARQREALEMLRSGAVRTAADYFHAAVIFQHGETADDAAFAFSLATTGSRIDPAHAGARWLAAAAWDRVLMRRGKPQWYGTQFVRDRDGKWVLYAIDEKAVTDAERQRHGVRTLAAQAEALRKMNSGAN